MPVIYTLICFFTIYSLQDQQDVKLLDARITCNFSRTIVAVLTELYNIYIMNDITKVKVHILPDIPGNFVIYQLCRKLL